MSEGSIFVVGSFVAACSIRVERLPTPGESVRGQGFVVEAGGKGFNIAAAARRLGAEVDGVFAIGTDHFTDLAEEAAASAGLPATMPLRFDGPTGTGIGFIDAQGENCIAVYPGANELLSAASVIALGGRLAQACIVAAQFEIGDAPILAAFELAKRQGSTTVLNPSPYRAMSAHMLRVTDMIVVNETEGSALAADFGLDAAARWGELASCLFAKGVQSLIVTFGADGASAWTCAGETIVQHAFPIDAIDTIGAGDAFLGALLAGLWSGRTLADCLHDAALCGAMVASRPGVLMALPARHEVAAFWERHFAAT